MATTQRLRNPGLGDGGADPSGRGGNTTKPFYKRSCVRIAASGAALLGAAGIGFVASGGSEENADSTTPTTLTTPETTTPSTTAPSSTPEYSIVDAEIAPASEAVPGWESKRPNVITVNDLVTSSDPQMIVNGVLANLEYGLNNNSVSHVYFAFTPEQKAIPDKLVKGMDEIQSDTLNPRGEIYDFDAVIVSYEPSEFYPEDQFFAVLRTTEGLQGYEQMNRTVRETFVKKDVVIDGVTHKTWQISAGEEIE